MEIDAECFLNISGYVSNARRTCFCWSGTMKELHLFLFCFRKCIMMKIGLSGISEEV